MVLGRSGCLRSPGVRFELPFLALWGDSKAFCVRANSTADDIRRAEPLCVDQRFEHIEFRAPEANARDGRVFPKHAVDCDAI